MWSSDGAGGISLWYDGELIHHNLLWEDGTKTLASVVLGAWLRSGIFQEFSGDLTEFLLLDRPFTWDEIQEIKAYATDTYQISTTLYEQVNSDDYAFEVGGFVGRSGRVYETPVPESGSGSDELIREIGNVLYEPADRS